MLLVARSSLVGLPFPAGTVMGWPESPADDKQEYSKFPQHMHVRRCSDTTSGDGRSAGHVRTVMAKQVRRLAIHKRLDPKSSSNVAPYGKNMMKSQDLVLLLTSERVAEASSRMVFWKR